MPTMISTNSTVKMMPMAMNCPGRPLEKSRLRLSLD